MLKTQNLKRETTAILENAYSISYDKEVNRIWAATFFLPLSDPKCEKVEQLQFVDITDEDGENIGLFRIMPEEISKSVEANRVKYECQHVLSTLMDGVLFGYHQIPPNTNLRTSIEYILSFQPVKHWYLRGCDFTRYFQYSWENENGLIDALFSTANCLDEEYEWRFDTSSYPWAIDLVRPETEPTCRVREGHNLVGFKIKKNPNQLINKLYALGQGEGVNQLNFAKINGGKKYIEDTASIAKYGEIRYIWVDRRFTDVYSLLSSARALLKKWKDPIVSWEIDAVDLIKAIVAEGDRIPTIDELRLYKVVRVQTKDFGQIDLRILKEKKQDMTGSPDDLSLTVGYVPSDLGTTQADQERRIQINELYSQGATNIYNYDKADNCDPSFPMRFSIYVDDDVVKINSVELTLETSRFRSYSKAIKGGGAMVGSTAAGGYYGSSTQGGGGSVQGGTSQSGGGSVQSATSSAGGGQTSGAGGDHRHRMFVGYGGSGPFEWGEYVFSARGQGMYAIKLNEYNVNKSEIWTEGSSGDHSHTVAEHTHNVSISFPAHTHNFSVNIPSHTHDFSVPAHTHEIKLPDHVHEIEYGIFEDSDVADQVKITIEGVDVPGRDTTRERFDLVPFLPKNDDGTIRRGKIWITLTPNKRARFEAQITMRVFIKSQLGGEF